MVSAIIGGAYNADSLLWARGNLYFIAGGGTVAQATITTSGNMILGTDPGGSELLRVGGGFRLNGQLNIVNADFSMSNSRAIYAGGSAIDNLRLYFDAGNTYYRAPSSGHVWQNSTATPVMSLTDGGALEINDWCVSKNFIGAKRAGSDSVTSGPFWWIGNATNPTAAWIGQLSASGHYDMFCYASSTWTRRLRMQSDGAMILGTDPTGSELLRIGGTAKFSGKITTVSAVPASFADLAAVRTWLAAQFA
jgi:hypothetical protein